MRHGVIIQFYAHNNEVRNSEFRETRLDAIDLHGELEYLNKIHGNTISGVLTGAGIALGNTGGTPPSNHSASGPHNHILNNTITNTREGIKVHMGTPDTLIEGNTIQNTTEPPMSRGILIQNAPRTIIRNNTITNNTAEGFWGILLEYDPGDSNAGNVGSGIPQDVEIIGNTVTGNTNGVRIAAGTVTVLQGNVIMDNTNSDFENLTNDDSNDGEEVQLHPTDDAIVDIERPDVNYGVEDPGKTASGASDRNWYRLFNVKANEDFTFGRIAYIKFDVSDVEVESATSAILELHGRTGSNTTSVALDVFGLIEDDWSETTLTWNNSPNHEPDRVKITGVGETAIHIGTVTINSPDTSKFVIDVTEFLNGQTDGYVTFMIIDLIGQNGNINIMSKENGDENIWPLLRISQDTEQEPELDEPLQIGNVKVADLDGNSLQDLDDASFVRVSATVTNVSDTATDGTLIVALYRPDGSIVRISYAEQPIAAGDSVQMGGGFDLPEDTTGYTIKIFVWNNMDDMVPVSARIRFPGY